MKFRHLLVFGLLAWMACESGSSSKSELEAELLSIKKQYIEDSRTAIFDFELEKEGDSIRLKGHTTEKDAFEHLDSVQQTWDWSLSVDFQLLPADSLNHTWGLTHLSAVNLRSRPAHSSELVTQAIMGTPIRILSRKADWHLVQTPDHYIGWLDAEAFTPMDTSALSQWRSSDRLVYLKYAGRLTEQPGPESPMVRDLVLGSILSPTGRTEDDYTEVQLPDGKSAWIPSSEVGKFTETASHFRSADADDLLGIGMQMMGVPYLWGGTSSKAVDCSGFTKTAFWMIGWLLPRDASQQVLVGKNIPITDSLEKLLPGDLIYFGGYREDGSPKITHVAIHMGNRKILHASGKVKVESLDPQDSLFNDYRYNTMMKATRILQQGNKEGLQTVRDHPWYF